MKKTKRATNKEQIAKKLMLNRETVRRLVERDLEFVAGAGPTATCTGGGASVEDCSLPC